MGCRWRSSKGILNDRFQLGVEGRVRVFYAPFVALGQQVYKAVRSLGDSSGLPRRTIYLPHPSGANNGHRVREFPLIREILETQVATWAKGVA